MYVPRFGGTNIVYDVIDGNNILTTNSNNTYDKIQIQDGILSCSNNTPNFNSPTGILYGSTTATGKWSLESTEITDGIFTRSNNTLVFNQPDGLIYGKTDKSTWSLDSVIIDKGILTKSNDLTFDSHTGLLYGKSTDEKTWSLDSVIIDKGILTKSNNTLGFNSPTGILYGSTENGVWSLNNVNNLTSYADSNDYVLYYGKDANNNNKVTPHWRLLTINGKNFSMQGGEVNNQWRNIVTNDKSDIVSIQTEYLNDQDYGIYNKNGKVVKLNTKVLNDIGLKFFSPSEINETGYITTNVIIYNSSTDSVSFPVNYYNVYNFHCYDNQYINDNDRSYMQNLQYTNGFYNFTTVSNNLPVYDQIKNTYDGFYNFIETNKINSNTSYLHFTTSLFVDSIIMPPDNNDNYNDYSINNISNYDCIIGIYTNFGKVEPNTFYQNIFFCNSNTPVLSAEDTSPLLGYLIVNLANIDKSGKVNINQLYDIDSTVPYNTNIINYDIDQLKNGILTFRPLFYKNSNNNIISLHYDKKINSDFYKHVIYIDSESLIINQNGDSNNYGILSTLYRNTDYIYYKDNLRLTENVTIDSNFNNMFHKYSIAISNDGIISKNIETHDETASITLNYIYCDTDVNNNVYYLNNCIKPFSYIVDERTTYYLSDPILGNVSNNNFLYNVCLLTDEPTIISNKQIILSKDYYTFISSTNESITVKNNNTDKEITLKGAYPSCNSGYISIKDIDNIYEINKFNNLVNENDGISLEYKTYVVQNFRINTSVIYNNSNTSNLHILVNNKNVLSMNYYIHYSTNNDNDSVVGVPLYKTNNIYVTEGKISRFTDNTISCNSNIYGIVNNDNRYEYYPIIFNNDYVYRKELLIPNDDNTFKYTLFGVIYNNTRYIFSAKDVSLNIYGQIVVNTDKYYYNSNERAIYSIEGYKIVQDDSIIYNEYIEILNNNYACNYITRTVEVNNQNVSIRFCYLYNKINIPINYEPLNSSIIHIKEPIKRGQNLYNPSNPSSNQYNLLSTAVINENTYNKTISAENNEITLTLDDLNINNIDENSTKAIITEEGIILIDNNSFIMKITSLEEFIYSDNHIDIPFFDTPIEKDMKVVLKPISKYSILSYNNKSYTNQAYTLAKNVGFKISLCNIYVTLTSYIGEYPSMIN